MGIYYLKEHLKHKVTFQRKQLYNAKYAFAETNTQKKRKEAGR